MTMKIIGWAIVHSLWQGGLISLVAGGLLAATRKAAPQLRYCIAMVALALMLVVPVATATLKFDPPALVSQSLPIAADISANDVTSSLASASSATPSPSVESTLPVVTSPAPTSRAKVADFVSSYVDGVLPWLVAAWMLGLLFSSVRLIGGFARTRTITRRATSAASRALELRMSKLSERLGVNRLVRTLESTAIDVPLVIGAIRPVIVVPVSLVTGLTPLQLDMLLAHELAHVRRHDYLINLVQTVVETLLFYHPAAWWISERAREERENCCDDIAIAACGVDPQQYTTTLLVLEESRGEGFRLAAAANGGSLLRRVQRIITGKSPYVELGPRWIAGVITIGAALFTGRDAIAGIQASYAPSSAFTIASDSTEKDRRAPDLSRAAPSKVTKAPAGNTLAERWRWAERNGGSGAHWIGYLVGGDPAGKSRFYASEMPVRIDGNVTLSGRMNLGDGDLSNFIFYGVPLAPLVGAHSPRSTAIFVQVSDGAMGRRVERVHIGSFGLPQYFYRLPLLWLDSASDGESVALIRSIMSSAKEEGTRSDLVAAIGVHRDYNVVTPRLIEILQSRDVGEVREEAAQWLGHAQDPRAIAALSNAARRDRDKDVREEAIEAFAHMQMPAATDTLIAFASSIREYDLRESVIESLGHRGDDRALRFLTSVVQSSDSRQIKVEALEALAEMPEGRGHNALIEIAERHPSSDIRHEAVEGLAHLQPTSRAFEILRRIVANDPDESVRAEAVETVAEVHDARAVQILADIANRNSSERVQVEAVEALGETVDPAAALPFLRAIARNHPLPEARKKALESIVSFRDDKASINELIQAARTDTDHNVRKGALEALAEGNDPAALREIESLVRGNESLELREAALEVYADAVYAPTAIAFLKRVISSDANIELRVRAVELLEDIDDDAGLTALREVARSSKDSRLKNRAAAILTDR